MPDYIYLLEHRLTPAQRNAVHHVRQAAREAGLTLFLAGGAVRDLTSGFPVRDLDFSVQGNALKLKKSLEKSAKLWGEHAASQTLYFWFPGSVRVEVSSTRREEFPKPGQPVYHWSTMLDDLRRRDFTANAMALSLNEGSYGLLLDPLNGIADIEARHLRLVSNYGFLEEPSRLVRAVRLSTRTGWQMDERTQQRYQNAKEEGVISSISPYLRGYELEEIGHEEDALRILQALEAEGWMEHLCAGWTSAKADLPALEELHKLYVQFLMQGVHPDLSAAQMRLLTAKMQPKAIAGLQKELPCPGFVDQWNHLDDAAKDFATKLLGKEASTPSATWKLIANYQPEPVLWLAFTSKSAPVKAKFKNFFEVWPEARQKIPTQMMAEMRITSDLPEYNHLLNELFFALIDGQLETDEAMRAFLEPYSPPAPPPPVSIRRSRSRKAEQKKVEEEEEDVIVTPAGYDEDDELGARADDEEESEEDEDEDKEEKEEKEEKDTPPARPALKATAGAAGKPATKAAAQAAARKPAATVPPVAVPSGKDKPAEKTKSEPAKKAAPPAPVKAREAEPAKKQAAKPAAPQAAKAAPAKAVPAKKAAPAPAKPIKKAAKSVGKAVARKTAPAKPDAKKAPAKPAPQKKKR